MDGDSAIIRTIRLYLQTSYFTGSYDKLLAKDPCDYIFSHFSQIGDVALVSTNKYNQLPVEAFRASTCCW